MIPAIAETWTASESSAPIPFDELDPQAMLTLEYLKAMYVGKEHPFLTSSRDGFTWLIIPRTIVRVFADADQIATEAPSPLRISNDGGRNGISN